MHGVAQQPGTSAPGDGQGPEAPPTRADAVKPATKTERIKLDIGKSDVAKSEAKSDAAKSETGTGSARSEATKVDIAAVEAVKAAKVDASKTGAAKVDAAANLVRRKCLARREPAGRAQGPQDADRGACPRRTDPSAGASARPVRGGCGHRGRPRCLVHAGARRKCRHGTDAGARAAGGRRRQEAAEGGGPDPPGAIRPRATFRRRVPKR